MGSSAVLRAGAGWEQHCGEPAPTNQQPTAGSLHKGRRPRDKQTRPEEGEGWSGKGSFPPQMFSAKYFH